MIKIGVTGSIYFENITLAKNVIFSLKKRFNGQEFVVISRGNKSGADKYVKKYALQMECTYREVNLAHSAFTLYSLLPEMSHGKIFHYAHFYIQNKIIANYVDYCIILNTAKKDPQTNGLISLLDKYEKEYIIL